jgi:exopolysaccharide/PEP-CTERM locus tyrosine autokinase
MSIIEKALEKLEQNELSGLTNAASARVPSTVDRTYNEGRIVNLDDSSLSPFEHLSRAPQPTKSSRQVELNLKALARRGFITPETMSSDRAEEFRRIKRPIIVTAFEGAANNRANVVMVTSSVAGEGKTFTTLNLAISAACELDRTVLLVDGDVFMQGLSRLLQLESEPGLTDYLKTEGADLSDFLLRTNIPNLVFLPAGRMDHQVAELWSSNRMHQLMNELANRYSDRLVLFDTPPLLQQASTAILGSMVGQVALVVEAEKTPQHVVHEALVSLGDVTQRAHVGLVLNKSNQRYSAEYGYGNYKK